MKERPISPHITIYTPLITSASSILSRLAGVYLYIFTVSIGIFLAFNITANKGAGGTLEFFLSLGAESKAWSIFLIVFSFGTVFAFFLYILSLVRHLIWDFGRCLDLKTSKQTGYAMFILSFLLSSLVTFYMFFV